MQVQVHQVTESFQIKCSRKVYIGFIFQYVLVRRACEIRVPEACAFKYAHAIS
jgi:hypothetical protein